jgi:hypothetical protein
MRTQLEPLLALRSLWRIIFFALLYAITLAGGIFIFLVASSAVGYLPYSDRPGPGWYNPHLPPLQEMSFFASWAFRFVGPFALLWGAILFLFTRLTAWLGAPKWLLRTLGGVFGSVLGLLGIAAAGWYIAISWVATDVGAVLGLLFGVILLPKFAVVRTLSPMHWWRWAALIGVTLCFAMGIIYPLLPDRDAQSLEVHVVRFVPGPEKITVENTGLLQSEVIVLNSLGLSGKLLGGIQSFSGGGDKQARVLIVVRGPVSSKAILREPKGTSAVYVQDGNRWNMYPSNATTLRKTITLMDGSGEYEGLSIAIEPVGKPDTFTWYPPIRRELH